MPAMVAYLNVEKTRLACAMAKALNAPSQAISAVSQELGQVREAVLGNRAAIDCLLLMHNHGRELFKGLCCFNLTESSQLIEHKVKQVNDVVSIVKQREGFFGIDLSELTSWLPVYLVFKRLLLFLSLSFSSVS